MRQPEPYVDGGLPGASLAGGPARRRGPKGGHPVNTSRPIHDHVAAWLDSHDQLCLMTHTIYRATAIGTTRLEEAS